MARTGQQMRRQTAKRIAESTPAAIKGSVPQEPKPLDRLRYMFDNSMAKGTPALVGWLSIVTFVTVLFFSVVFSIFKLRGHGNDPGGHHGFFAEFFSDLLHALDPGAIGGDSGSWPFLIVLLFLTIAGLFVVSALIGVIAAGIDTKLADLRRGRSVVLESDHTVILGWSDSVYTIISELTLANESRKKPVIVVMADMDKVEMEDLIKSKVPDMRGTRLVCRSGSPMDIADLTLSSHSRARSVIVLAPAGSDDPDSEVIKILLALTHSTPDGPRIVAEIRNPSNLEAARLVGKERVTLLDIRETVAKLVVQTSRQSGAAAVYTELFDYDGDEIYFLEDGSLDGKTYAEAQLAFEAAAVIGLQKDGVSTLNPPGDTVIAGHTVIVVAEDDSALEGQAVSSVQPELDLLGEQVGTDAHPTQAVLIGWNDRAEIICRELDNYAPPGSTLTILTSYAAPSPPHVDNLAITVEQCPTTDRATLERHIVEGLDQILVLCYSDDLEPQAADARTLVTLLHVRDILSKRGESTPVVSEMLDDRNRILAQVANVDDVVVSGEIVSLIVTQLSEDPRLEPVFAELLDDEGAEIYLRPAEWYVKAGHEVSFATIVAGATRRGETAIGYKSHSLGQSHEPFAVVVNPAKSDMFLIEPDDRVVVLAAD